MLCDWGPGRPLHAPHSLCVQAILAALNLCVDWEGTALREPFIGGQHVIDPTLPAAAVGRGSVTATTMDCTNVVHAMRLHLDRPEAQRAAALAWHSLDASIPPRRRPHVRRLFKLLWPALFPHRDFRVSRKIGSGAFAAVLLCTARLPDGEMREVAIKQFSCVRSGHQRARVSDVFAEVAAMERLAGSGVSCELLDYGIADGAYWLVLRRYECTLMEWREQHHSPLPAALHPHLSTFLHAYERCVASCARMHACGVTHYDIKCDNILLRRERSPGEEAAHSRLHVVFADFGEACTTFSRPATAQVNRSNRGTEWIKSPEMLVGQRRALAEMPSFDRRRDRGTNASRYAY